MSLGGATKRGIAWALSSNLANQVLQFGVGIVLARLLVPADFGVFATTGIFTGLAATVSNIGLGSALVQRVAIEERHRRTMLTANLVSLERHRAPPLGGLAGDRRLLPQSASPPRCCGSSRSTSS